MCGQTDKGCVSARFKLPERNASGMRLHLWRGDQLLSTNMKELLLWLCPCVASYVQSPSRSFWARLPARELSCTSSCACGCDCESTLETVFAGKAHLIAVTPPPQPPTPQSVWGGAFQSSRPPPQSRFLGCTSCPSHSSWRRS